MKYFSAFSGIGGFELGIKAVFPDAECVGYSEIDKYAIQVYQKQFPSHKNYGDITQIDFQNLPDFDLLVGGSPCQDLSIAKRGGMGVVGEKSKLFFKFVELLRAKKPKFFLLENVASMPDEDKMVITSHMCVDPVMIDAKLVSAQCRKRLYWCNWDIGQLYDSGIMLKDVLGNKRELAKLHTEKQLAKFNKCDPKTDKQATLTEAISRGGSSAEYINTVKRIYKLTGIASNLTVNECAILQGFPPDWASNICNTKAYKAYGNAVHVKVIEHIMKGLYEKKIRI
jgi:site-specific DNA-cytosine methylase